MKSIVHKILLLLIISSFQEVSFAQDCTDYHVENCRWADRTFLYSRQSRSALFTPRMKSNFSIVVYGGEEYYISVSGHRKLGDIRVRLKEDDEKQTILYDNANFKYEKYFYFKNALTKKLIIEVSVPENEKYKNEKFCVGVLIEFRRNKAEESSNQLGF